jgi:hypothetical protein
VGDDGAVDPTGTEVPVVVGVVVGGGALDGVLGGTLVED